MSDLTRSQWAEIERQSVYLPQDGRRSLGRYIGLDELAKILRKSRRSGSQNNLLWSLYTDAIRQGGETLGGWTTEDLHEYMLGEFFGWQVHEVLGRKRQKPVRRSSRLTKAEFSDFVEFVVRRFAEHNIVLQLPGEQDAA